MRHASGKGGQRSKSKWKPNRYNPNHPDWNRVHRPASFNALLGPSFVFPLATLGTRT